MDYGKTREVAARKRSNRQRVEWVPVTQLVYGKAIVAANLAGVDLAIWVDDAIAAHLARTERQLEEEQFAEACRDAADRMRPSPMRHEFHPAKAMPFVRRPAGVADGQAGRPSSRHHQEGRGAQAGSTAPQAGPEPRAAAGAQRRSEHGEDPPVDLAERPGTYRPLNTP